MTPLMISVYLAPYLRTAWTMMMGGGVQGQQQPAEGFPEGAGNFGTLTCDGPPGVWRRVPSEERSPAG